MSSGGVEAAPESVPCPKRPVSQVGLVSRTCILMCMTASQQQSKPVARYGVDDAKAIINAYRDIFPEITPELAAYFDFDRKRPWSYLTSNFHCASLEQYQRLSDAVEQIELDAKARHPVPATELANRLVLAARKEEIGFSLGFGPWTDHGLYSTYGSGRTNRLTILVGHDWYPIVPKRAREPHPLNWPLRQDGLHMLPSHKAADYYAGVAQSVLDAESVLLFLNLYPDYREPEEHTTGAVKAGYAGCLDGFEAVLAATRHRYHPDDVTIISWGAYPWKILSARTGISRPPGIMGMTEDLAGEPLHFRSRGHTYSYLPLAHPSEKRNFQVDFHLEHVRVGFQKLGLGAPARAPSARKRPTNWKARV